MVIEQAVRLPKKIIIHNINSQRFSWWDTTNWRFLNWMKITSWMKKTGNKWNNFQVQQWLRPWQSVSICMIAQVEQCYQLSSGIYLLFNVFLNKLIAAAIWFTWDIDCVAFFQEGKNRNPLGESWLITNWRYTFHTILKTPAQT